jgi:hypothetical protein
VWHQEDASALLSPKLFEEFIKPYDKQIVDSLQGCIMHMHPGGFTPIEEMIDIGMDAIELHVDQGGKKARELNHLHLQILKDKPLLIWGQLSDDDLNYIFSELPYEGLAINVMVDSPDKAQQIWNRYMKQYNV